VKNCVLYG